MFDLSGILGVTLTPNLIIVFGFVTGLTHATEADHVTAVATMVSRHRKLTRASLLGALWGIGHTSTLFMVGLAVLLLAVSIPAKLALSMEFGVGIMLVVLGLSVVKSARDNRFLNAFLAFSTKHMHPHAHGNTIHTHPHSHDEHHEHSHRSILVGMVHGMAGSGALMLLVLSTVDSVGSGLAYITLFGVGSIVGMLAISTVIGLPFVFTARKFARVNQYIRIVAAFVSMGIGMNLMYEIAMVEQLFSL
jgi:sulfite exporter TauE/SafE